MISGSGEIIAGPGAIISMSGWCVWCQIEEWLKPPVAERVSGVWQTADFLEKVRCPSIGVYNAQSQVPPPRHPPSPPCTSPPPGASHPPYPFHAAHFLVVDVTG